MIKVEKKEILLELSSKDTLIDSETWQEDGNLSKNLLKKIDDLLSRNGLKITDIHSDIKVKADNESYTSARITKVIAEVMKYSLS